MFNLKATLTPDYERYDGVRPIQIFAMRVGYVLVVVTVGNVAWSRILQHEGGWDPLVAAAVSMWAGSSVLSIFGLIHPLKWLPIVLFEIAYKSIWLAIVAYPLWSSAQLAGSPAEGLTYAFLWVVVPIVAMPWGHVFRTYVLPSRVARRGI
jgi:hypothetical protein